jgi:hypothetical protein
MRTPLIYNSYLNPSVNNIFKLELFYLIILKISFPKVLIFLNPFI